MLAPEGRHFVFYFLLIYSVSLSQSRRFKWHLACLNPSSCLGCRGAKEIQIQNYIQTLENTLIKQVNIGKTRENKGIAENFMNIKKLTTLKFGSCILVITGELLGTMEILLTWCTCLSVDVSSHQTSAGRNLSNSYLHRFVFFMITGLGGSHTYLYILMFVAVVESSSNISCSYRVHLGDCILYLLAIYETRLVVCPWGNIKVSGFYMESAIVVWCRK